MDAELGLRTKVCTKCGQERPMEEFCKNRKSKDGLFCWCKQCKKEYNHETQDRIRARRSEYNRSERNRIREGERRRIKRPARTVNYYTSVLWCTLNRRTINGSRPRWDRKQSRIYLNAGVELRLSREQLHALVEDNWDTIQAIRVNGEIPSIDRIGPSIHYEVGNVRFISLSENSRKSAIRTNTLRRRRAKLIVAEEE